jgi:hypothetical protein
MADEMSMYKRKMKLRQEYKCYMAGLKDWGDIDPETRILLSRYYGLDSDGFPVGR